MNIIVLFMFFAGLCVLYVKLPKYNHIHKFPEMRNLILAKTFLLVAGIATYVEFLLHWRDLRQPLNWMEILLLLAAGTIAYPLIIGAGFALVLRFVEYRKRKKRVDKVLGIMRLQTHARFQKPRAEI